MEQKSKQIINTLIAISIILAVLVIDQVIKIEVKTNMTLGEAIRVTDWFYIDFIENNGMAYGMKFINKLVLSLFRLFAICFIGWYLFKIIKRGVASRGYISCIAVILAGAAGNLIDCLFYGLIFTESTPFNIAQFVSWGEGYSSLLHGKVVDMFYFPIIQTTWPNWVPLWGGNDFVFFSPVFNFADACISVGVVLLLIFYRKQVEQLFTK